MNERTIDHEGNARRLVPGIHVYGPTDHRLCAIEDREPACPVTHAEGTGPWRTAALQRLPNFFKSVQLSVSETIPQIDLC
jgi:hypothetical protein